MSRLTLKLGGKEAEKAIIRIALLAQCSQHAQFWQHNARPVIINGASKATAVLVYPLTANKNQKHIETSGCELLPRKGYAYYKTPDYRQPTLFELKKTPENYLQSVIKYWNEYKPEKKHKFFWEK